ncbi:MAG: DUF4384 domain-containing protein [Polyangiaceae bacterium]
MRRALWVLAMCVSGCGAGAGPAGDASGEVNSTQQGHLLLFPVSDYAALLGRPVHATADGVWTVADSRLPGCEVLARPHQSRFKTRRQVELRSLASLSGGFAQLVSLEAEHGQAVRSDVEVENTQVVDADVRGDCGQQFVNRVFVGHGQRALRRTTTDSAGASVPVASSTLGGSVSSASDVLDLTEWSEEQAYAFGVGGEDEGPLLEVSIESPRTFVEGELVQVGFKVSQPSYLIVFSLEESGAGTVLWPSDDERAPKAAPGAIAMLPSAKEEAAGVQIRAALRTKGRAARETLVVYALSEKEDFDRLRPPPNESDADGAALAATLTEKLQLVPLRRWSRAIHSYSIIPQ